MPKQNYQFDRWRPEAPPLVPPLYQRGGRGSSRPWETLPLKMDFRESPITQRLNTFWDKLHIPREHREFANGLVVSMMLAGMLTATGDILVHGPRNLPAENPERRFAGRIADLLRVPENQQELQQCLKPYAERLATDAGQRRIAELQRAKRPESLVRGFVRWLTEPNAAMAAERPTVEVQIDLEKYDLPVGEYTVWREDTLERIAARIAANPADVETLKKVIQELNKDKAVNWDHPAIGLKIKIPARPIVFQELKGGELTYLDEGTTNQTTVRADDFFWMNHHVPPPYGTSFRRGEAIYLPITPTEYKELSPSPTRVPTVQPVEIISGEPTTIPEASPTSVEAPEHRVSPLPSVIPETMTVEQFYSYWEGRGYPREAGRILFECRLSAPSGESFDVLKDKYYRNYSGQNPLLEEKIKSRYGERWLAHAWWAQLREGWGRFLADNNYTTVIRILQEENVPLDFVFLAFTESHFSTEAVSRTKACGPWQFMPGTAKEMGLALDDRLDVEKSTRAACGYLKKKYREISHWVTAYNKKNPRATITVSEDDMWCFAAAAYNGGATRVKRLLPASGGSYAEFVALNPNAENRAYVPKIFAVRQALGEMLLRGWPDQLEPAIGRTLADKQFEEYLAKRQDFDQQLDELSEEQIERQRVALTAMLEQIEVAYQSEQKSDQHRPEYVAGALSVITDEKEGLQAGQGTEVVATAAAPRVVTGVVMAEKPGGELVAAREQIDLSPILVPEILSQMRVDLYIARPGDTWQEIAQMAAFSPSQITIMEQVLHRLNPEFTALTDLSGKQIRIPLNNYRVPSRTLASLVKKVLYRDVDSAKGIRWIKILNGIDPDTGVIKPGDEISVPADLRDYLPQSEETEVSLRDFRLRPGDDLGKLASWSAPRPDSIDEVKALIRAGNPQINNWSRLRVGQEIKIPVRVIVVKRGDTIGELASRYFCGRTNGLEAINHLRYLNGKNSNTLKIGEVISVPVAEDFFTE